MISVFERRFNHSKRPCFGGDIVAQSLRSIQNMLATAPAKQPLKRPQSTLQSTLHSRKGYIASNTNLSGKIFTLACFEGCFRGYFEGCFEGVLWGRALRGPLLPPLLPRYSLSTPLLRPLTPLLLPLKRPCSLSRTETVIPNPKFGVYIDTPNLQQHTS